MFWKDSLNGLGGTHLQRVDARRNINASAKLAKWTNRKKVRNWQSTMAALSIGSDNKWKI